MKNKHRIKQGLSLLLAGGIALANLGVALPAFAEDAPATPETASAATPETAEANVLTPNLSQITENLYRQNHKHRQGGRHMAHLVQRSGSLLLQPRPERPAQGLPHLQLLSCVPP